MNSQPIYASAPDPLHERIMLNLQKVYDAATTPVRLMRLDSGYPYLLTRDGEISVTWFDSFSEYRVNIMSKSLKLKHAYTLKTYEDVVAVLGRFSCK